MNDLWREQALNLFLDGKSLFEIHVVLGNTEGSTTVTLAVVVREIEEQLKWMFGGINETAERELSVVLVEILHELNLTDEASRTLQRKCIERRCLAVSRIKAALGMDDG